MPRLSGEVRTHIDKACESALLAVETYNRPGARFRSGGFVVLMCIAWTALFHAIFFKRKIQPFYRKAENRRHFKRVDGDKKAWELTTCLEHFWEATNPPDRANLSFFVGLRNKIEHRSMPAIDISLFGECQALLFNFEDLIVKEFGSKYALNESLSLALQFSVNRSEQQAKAVKRLHQSLAKDVALYVKAFRTSLSSTTLSDPRFSYKVFLIPKPANHLGSADVSVEFIKFDPSKPEEMERYEKIVSLVKPSPPSVVTSAPLPSTGEGTIARVRIVDDPNATGLQKIDYDDSHPFIQRILLANVNGRLPDGAKINQYDLLAVRRTNGIESRPNFYHKGAFGPSQYSAAFADWLVDSFAKDKQFFVKARAAYKTANN